MSTISLPSRMQLQVRGLTGRDGRYLANEKLVRDDDVEDYVFANCFERMLDPGPYAFDAKPDWGKMLIGDRTALTMAIRLATYPDEKYPVPLRCVNRLCRKRFEWEVDIELMLKEKLQPLSDEAYAVVAKKERFEIRTSTGHRVWFKLKTGADAKRYKMLQDQFKNGASARKRERQNDLVNGFLFFGAVIEGIDPKSPKADEAKQDFLEELPLREINRLRIEMAKHDCGVDTTIEVECIFCNQLWEVELPFDRSFFAPPDPELRLRTTKKAASESDESEEQAT